MGLPLGLPDDDIDVCFPLAEHHLQTRVEPPFDSSATSNLNHNATFLEHNSYWNIFVGTEGANASSAEYSNGLDPFSGFDIPFWFDQEQHWDFT
ncbi:hypothetical protein J4E81_005662 [Alternaria sp. BMP 2799]|nr:hypothetical protein J4E81_005662 [Alternaria sp. BMP 2799]